MFLLIKQSLLIKFNVVALFYSFYADFGPLNLAMLYRYCCKLIKKLKVSQTPARFNTFLLKNVQYVATPIQKSWGICTHWIAGYFGLSDVLTFPLFVIRDGNLILTIQH